ncbi:DUF423 domain-containing protein [Magnetospirillum gryphiswaldense]|jgi:uncharacterized membrane protein YgdD (TMEM256/DUF423 family)|uniref:DUF423 domain-containing protein n=2 Tax=Magnetospirillum gryphiswaldense TaxID=55518 RepID=V6EWC6_MAGGM|nr:DUF423 domain-containing protein [Magnetospirillum gryphiswaldense]AVM74412.1 hypothetical protein MSR1_19230 [Magnetospirillum gryphiswaldense MSR-1]AVM78315.1 hypothetical protein MSR1L_19230 [Magnetospirillum gryphiswaldense]CAM75091.1 membrane protein containing DUF423 [Magnetospirillum gryphiswaldense MSR-1]CDK97494.1 conserved protein of unknown function [Magnetospirillum gryphiswaldense MSR-1 v2]
MRPWIVLAGLSGLMAVGMGAYGAHGLAGEADAQALVAQAANYQIIHALALLGADRITVDTRRGGGMLAHGAALLFALGMALFCGSLYVKALTGAPLAVPMVTPAGGMTLMAGWLVLALAGFRK